MSGVQAWDVVRFGEIWDSSATVSKLVLQEWESLGMPGTVRLCLGTVQQGVWGCPHEIRSWTSHHPERGITHSLL